MDAGGQWRDSEVLDLIVFGGTPQSKQNLKVLTITGLFLKTFLKKCPNGAIEGPGCSASAKVKSLKAKYKEAKDLNQRSGRGRVTCPFYEELERILGDAHDVINYELRMLVSSGA